ncbi:MAG: UDP-N-acetylmuramoyl-L-alanyl-D-glutamate--2,6-diaminopimelate ligase [Campylobacterota bacterium]|nr:UDP-N-acetylmuramoyl-L-alanyl-D-glutamate--2,6-diaminopimelate ligase [Campylobacterota bacterium]
MKNLEHQRLKITQNNTSFTDNSKDANNEIVFVKSSNNKDFENDAKLNGCRNIINSSELKNYFDFSTIKIVGITGTNGKTTTAAAIYSILLDLGYKVALQGTRGFFINDEKSEEYSLTTPVQLTNFSHIQKAINNNCQFFIMEVSSHAIEQNRIEGLNFTLKIHTNITSDHLDYHNNLEEYVKVKNSFFQDDAMKLINKDDDKIKFKMKNAYAYGLENPSTYKVTAYSLKNGIHVAIQHFSNVVNFSSSMMGLFNVYNLTAAVGAVNLLTQKPLQEICNMVEYFGGVSGRMEVVSTNPLVIVDFAHTFDGMKEVFNSFASSDIICVFGAGGDRDISKRAIMGKIASDFCKEIIITSDNPRFEDPDLICEDILKGITDKSNVTLEINRKEAIKLAISKATNNSVVLVLGKGDETSQIIYDQKLPFNDKEVIKEVLNEYKQ